MSRALLNQNGDKLAFYQSLVVAMNFCNVPYQKMSVKSHTQLRIYASGAQNCEESSGNLCFSVARKRLQQLSKFWFFNSRIQLFIFGAWKQNNGYRPKHILAMSGGIRNRGLLQTHNHRNGWHGHQNSQHSRSIAKTAVMPAAALIMQTPRENVLFDQIHPSSKMPNAYGTEAPALDRRRNPHIWSWIL